MAPEEQVMTATFTPAGLEDLDLLVELTRRLGLEDPSVVTETVGGVRRQTQVPFDEDRARAAIAGLLDAPSLGRIWVIRRQGLGIGYVVLAFGYSVEEGGRVGFVDEIYVAAEHRGRGLGTAALEVVEQACREIGARALRLEVELPNEGARRLYRRLGFVAHDRRTMTKRLED